MQSVLNQSYSLDILPDTDPTGTTSFGLNAGMAGTSLAEGDHQFFVRTFYAENVDNSTAGTAPGDVLDSFLYGAFPAFANKAAGGTVVQKDWRGETFDIDKIHAIVFEVKPKEALEVTSASGMLTSNGVHIADGATVTIGTIVYRFKTSPSQAYDIDRDGNAATALDHLKKAINGTGTAGVEYYAGTLVHPSVTAEDATVTSPRLEITSIRPGAAGNVIATTTSPSVNLSFATATLIGGGEPQSPPVPRGLEGTVRIVTDGNFMPGTSELDFTVSGPCLMTFTVPAGWTPGSTATLNIIFDSTEPAPLGPADVNAVVTVSLIGSSN